MRRSAALACVLVLATGALAQTSPSYRLTESVLNAAGHPASGVVLSSAGFRVTLDAVGEPVLTRRLAGSSFHLEGGFVFVYPPPGEVLGLDLDDSTTLTWLPEASLGLYNVYRGSTEALPSGTNGACYRAGLTVETAGETAVPEPGRIFFYLVTAVNRLGEEGTKGLASDGSVRPNPDPCP
jgi:hypothetical protein